MAVCVPQDPQFLSLKISCPTVYCSLTGKNVVVCNGGYRVKLIGFSTAYKADHVPILLSRYRWHPVFAAPEVRCR